MAIIINIYYTGENGKARMFADDMELKGIADKIRNEDGNLRYQYFFPYGDNDTVLLIDSWTNQEALDKHHASEMMTEISELREKYNLTMKVERYISDEDGVPESDKKFIRE